MKADQLYAEIRALESLPVLEVQAKAGGFHTDRETERAVDGIFRGIVPEANARLLAPVASVFESLLAKAKDGTLSDNDLVDAIHDAALAMPEVFAHMDEQPLAAALEQAMGVAMVNGAMERQRLAEGGE